MLPEHAFGWKGSQSGRPHDRVVPRRTASIDTHTDVSMHQQNTGTFVPCIRHSTDAQIAHRDDARIVRSPHS